MFSGLAVLLPRFGSSGDDMIFVSSCVLENDRFIYSDYLTSSFLHKVILTRDSDYDFRFDSSSSIICFGQTMTETSTILLTFGGYQSTMSLPTVVKAKFSLTCKEHIGLIGH